MDEVTKSALLGACSESYSQGVRDIECAIKEWLRNEDPALSNKQKNSLWNLITKYDQGGNYLPDYVRKHFEKDK